MRRDGAGVAVQRLERGVPVGGVGLDDRNHLLGIDAKGLLADDVAGVVDRNRAAPRNDLHAVVDVVHSVEVFGLPGVDLDDDLLGVVEVGAVGAHRRARHQFAVGGDCRGLDDCEVELAEEAHVHQLRRVRQVHVGVLRHALVDHGTHDRVGLVRSAEAHSAGLGQGAVEFGCGRSAGEHPDGEVLAASACLGDPLGQGDRELLGIPGAGESGEADRSPGMYESGSLGSAHDLVRE